jgi:DNA replicative helicase MCM subunit Mcm2 (Cdc46/Mcm family)
MTRFHLVFFIRRPDIKRFKQITESIISGMKKELGKEDIKFIKDYIEYTGKTGSLDFPKSLQPNIIEFIAELKKNENKYLIEISPRMTIGFMRLCKGLAKLEGRGLVNGKDVERVKGIVLESLKIE